MNSTSRRCLASLVVAVLGGCTVTEPPVGFDVPVQIDGGIPGDAGLRPTVEPCTDPGATLGDACTDAADCQDLCFCNGEEVCTGGVCAAGGDPCADDVDCTNDACLEETNACFNMPHHPSCSDGAACNGYERCDLNMGCVPASPLYCNDEDSCTLDACDDTMGCVYVTRDLDRDGFVSGMCGGDDCDDDPRYGTLIFPGAPEICDNRRDDDCNGRRDYDDDTCLPTNDSCATATELRLGPTSSIFSASTEGLRTDYTIACASGVSSGDAVFRFTLTESHDVLIRALGTSRAAIALRDFAACATGPDLKCGSSNAASVFVRSLPAGDYAVVVRTAMGESFDLRVELSAPSAVPPVDVCAGDTLDVSVGGMFRGRFDEVSDDYALSCHAGTFADAAFRLVIPDDGMPRDVTITGSTSGGAFSSTTFLQLTTNCGAPGATLRCTNAAMANIRQRPLGPGTYFILLESASLEATEWTLNVTVGPAAARTPGDACTTALDLTPTLDAMGMGTRSQTVAIGTLEIDGGVSCGGSPADARDAYFRIDLAVPADITLTSSASTTTHYTAMQNTCGATGSERRCRGGMSPLSQIFRGVPAGTHYFVVQTTATTGNVDVRADVRPATPIPMNDACPGIALTSPVSRRDTLIGFEDDAVGGSCYSGGRVDAFYTFTVPTARRTFISAAAITGSPSVGLSLRSGAATCSGAVLHCASGAGTATINQVLPAGTYTVMVEMNTADETDFDLDIVP